MEFISVILVIACVFSIFDFLKRKYIFTFFRNIYTVNNKRFFVINTIIHIVIYLSLMVMAFILDYAVLRRFVWIPICILFIYEFFLKKVVIKKGYITEKSKEEV